MVLKLMNGVLSNEYEAPSFNGPDVMLLPQPSICLECFILCDASQVLSLKNT